MGKFYDSATDTLKWHHAAPDLTPEFTDFQDYLMMPAVSERPKTTAEILQQLQRLRSLSSSIPTAPLADAPMAFAAKDEGASLEVDEGSASQPQEVKTPRAELNEQFVQQCQRELAEYVGPIAAILCQQTLAENPSFSERDFIEALSRHITNFQDADHFKRKFR